jgi:hypothetical protein
VRLQQGTAGTFYKSEFLNNRATTTVLKKKGVGPTVGLQDSKDVPSNPKTSYSWFQGCRFEGNRATNAPEAEVSHTPDTFERVGSRLPTDTSHAAKEYFIFCYGRH